ncbi:DUF21-domain-containing protein [Xylona heveae TC161]|uniref:DUF21-domain-containing protein n=1 Tax=Xylona heveae (strain CBS 132557 / TC161) TaxID=1328760 RepID=A0A165FMD5_XYLHT|nr:DUF21-domain-containing protein [Xylona heveae TC161]KZF21153.1 DUF21-domain-containing protein [Xylona heveae TC161]
MALPFLKMLFMTLLANLPMLRAAPLLSSFPVILDAPEGKPPTDPRLWVYLGVAVVLVLLGGAFAGLTIALMGQDEIYLQVIHTSGEGAERKHAGKVLRLLKRGKHWVLVTLLLANVITNETLPIVLDRSLGGGWPAVLSSTVLIVIFGEIAPQSVCVRYGLPIGAFMSPFVLVLMWLLSPVAWPTAKLLDYLLGEDHGTTYKKAGLKTLVTLHKTLGASPAERLNQDEVTIITAVLDLKAKTVGSIMTPMDDVFTMSADQILDEKTMDTILYAGYSRIPIHAPNDPRNFIGMLLVKMLITYDPEDGKRVRDFSLATLPETRPETSCLDIVNFFQEGKSHMVLVSDFPGENFGALGVVTLEDVIEELIGEEIIDESDVFVDVHKAIRRMAPAPKYRVPKGEFFAETPTSIAPGNESQLESGQAVEAVEQALEDQTDGARERPSLQAKRSSVPEVDSPKATFLLRRSSSVAEGGSGRVTPVQLRATAPDLRQHLRHLGPSNLASRPKQTRYGSVKIKPAANLPPSAETAAAPVTVTSSAPQGGMGEGLLGSAGRAAADGVHALHLGYGSFDKTSPLRTVPEHNREAPIVVGDAIAEEPSSPTKTASPKEKTKSTPERKDRPVSQGSIISVRSRSRSTSPLTRRDAARSGSITENIIDTGGFRKLILETNDGSDEIEIQTKHNAEAADEEDSAGQRPDIILRNTDAVDVEIEASPQEQLSKISEPKTSHDEHQPNGDVETEKPNGIVPHGDENQKPVANPPEPSSSSGKKKRRRKKKSKKNGGTGTSTSGESTPLLGNA